ncbi:MAG: PepSY-associated TM helix domain-containing protein [Pyrinomonadaceae bacterium]
MSVTGVLLTYQRQITAWADARNHHVTRPYHVAARLSIETLLAQTRVAHPALPATVTLRADPSAPAAFGFSGGRTVFVNTYTGEVLGEGSPRVRAFFRSVTDWHRWLGAQGENRAVARSITGACNLAFLVLVVSGFYLWWPRKWTWKLLRNVTWFKRGLHGKARDFNWHNVIGLWSAVPLLIVVLSGVVISYPWASNLVYRLAGETPPAPRAAPPAQSPGGDDAAARRSVEVSLDGLNSLWLRSEQQVSNWQSISLQLPTSNDALAVFTIDQGDGGQPQKRAQLTLDRTTGEVVRWEPFSSYTRGRQLRSLLRFAHTGEVAGIVGQMIAGFASLAGAFLVWTGLALAWKRLRAWITKRAAGGGHARAATALPKEDAADTI